MVFSWSKINLQWNRETFNIHVKHPLESIFTKACFSLPNEENQNLWTVYVERVSKQRCWASLHRSVSHPYIFSCSWEFNSFWVVVTETTREKEMNLEWWGVKSGWVRRWRHLAQWNLSSENCQSSSSLQGRRNMSKRVLPADRGTLIAFPRFSWTFSHAEA